MGEMELIEWIFGGVILILSFILWNLEAKFDVQKEHCFELENNIILLEERIDKMSYYTNELEKRLINLESKGE